MVTSRREQELARRWKVCQEELQRQLPPDDYARWIAPVQPRALDNGRLQLVIPTNAFAEQLDGRLYEPMASALKRSNCTLDSYAIMDHPQPRPMLPEAHPPAKQQMRFNLPKGTAYMEVNAHLEPSRTFENFIEGDCNHTARSMALAVADNLGNHDTLSPFTIYGGLGLGKTHLAQAIGLRVRAMHPEKLVVYVTVDEFMDQFLLATHNDKIRELLAYYQQVDMLIVDDIQDFATRVGTQNAFFSILNHLHHHHRQLVFTSNCPPNALKGIREDLTSRFKWGVLAELSQPDSYTRLAILRHRLLRDGAVDFPEDVLAYVAEHVTTNLRDLEGVMNTLLVRRIHDKTPLDLRLAERVVRDHVGSAPSRKVDIPGVMGQVADYFRISVQDLASPTRRTPICEARQVAMYLCRERTGEGLERIGEQFNRHHTTVLHSCKVVENLLQVDTAFASRVKEIEDKISILWGR